MTASMRRVSVVWFVALALALSLIGTLAVPVRAAGFTVNTDVDASDATAGNGVCEATAGVGDCTLRAAFEEANGFAGADSITVPAGTYLLENGQLTISDDVTITGATAATTTINGNDDERVIDIDDADAAISNVTIRGGSVGDDDGAGIRVGSSASLNLANSVVIDNHVSAPGSGGGIYIADGGAATISGSAIGTTDDPNTVADDGGGIFVGEGSTLSLTGGSTVTGNTAGADGGGIYIDDDDAVAQTNVTISGSTISGNAAESDGGGIFVNDFAIATITGSTISGNAAGDDGGGEGGGISVDGTATLDGSFVTGNTAEGMGGGIYIDTDGTVNLNAGSVVSGNGANEGGGIANEGSDTLNMNGSTVSGNEAESDGGGIWNRFEATAVIVNSTIDSNTAGAVVQGSGNGGGIYSDICCGASLTITGSTISNNDANGGSGGGVYTDANGEELISLVNSTVSGNTADQSGGGIYNQDVISVEFSTIAENTAPVGEGGGLWFQGEVELYATIVADNTGGDCANGDGSLLSLGSNLDTDNSCELDAGPSDQPNVADARLGPLANNTGPTQTHALLFDSLAVDAVEPAVEPVVQADFLLVGAVVLPSCAVNAPTDQRGVVRPQDGDSDGVAVCDIGAYELLPPSVSITDVTVIEGDSGTVNAVFTVTLSRPSTGTVTYAFATANDTATVVADYQAATGTVTFAPNDVSETITVLVVGDTIDEPNETFFVNLVVGVGGTLLDAQGVGTILDDEGPIVTPTPAAGQLPNTGTGDAGLGGWGGPGLAIGLVAVSAAAWLSARRRVVRAR